ncbi:unnamed protein product [Polarella glacialis]|uniref:Uncharacterized protein n=1 Tax=Polarella glacialis TaxID=89957 RepID=A0A813H2E4_POLGL|nr:unnamed protein product [Polarella glacialis]
MSFCRARSALGFLLVLGGGLRLLPPTLCVSLGPGRSWLPSPPARRPCDRPARMSSSAGGSAVWRPPGAVRLPRSLWAPPDYLGVSGLAGSQPSSSGRADPSVRSFALGAHTGRPAVALKAARAKSRAQRFAGQPFGILRRAVIKAPTALAYSKAVALVRAFAHSKSLSLRTAVQWDVAMDRFFDHLFLSGDHPWVGRNALWGGAQL